MSLRLLCFLHREPGFRTITFLQVEIGSGARLCDGAHDRMMYQTAVINLVKKSL